MNMVHVHRSEDNYDFWINADQICFMTREHGETIIEFANELAVKITEMPQEIIKMAYINKEEQQ